jgi:ATP-binding cassette subfamily F protein uup
VLLLDEPTNHLDFGSILWLEGLLRDFKGSVLFITHDRSFLDNVSTRIIELDRGKLLSFPGNFSTYQARKAELLANEEVENAKFDKFLAQEEVWIRKGVQARRTRDEGRVRRLEALRVQRSERRDRKGRSSWKWAGERSGKIVAELENVSKAYGPRPSCATSAPPHARRQGRPDRPERRRQDHAAEADPGRGSPTAAPSSRAPRCRWRTSTRCARS